MSDWASWGTAVGTLILAVATFASVRSANQAGRNAERALQVGLRPVLFQSRPDEIVQNVRWGDGHWAALSPGRAVLETQSGIIYMAMSLQNVGAGIAVLLGWRVDTFEILNPQASLEEMRASAVLARPDPATFRPQTQDQFSPPGSISYWGAAIRTEDDPDRTTGGSCFRRSESAGYRLALRRPRRWPANNQSILDSRDIRLTTMSGSATSDNIGIWIGTILGNRVAQLRVGLVATRG